MLLMGNYHKLYNKAYEKMTPDWLDDPFKAQAYLEKNASTMTDFFESYCEQFNYPHKSFDQMNVLVLGCGLGAMSTYFAKKGANVTGIDVSDLAIGAAKEYAKAKELTVEYKIMDLSKANLADKKYDLIFDAHLLHCLTGKQDRENLLKFVNESLSDEGIFLSETMVFQKQIRTPVGYSLDENDVLWKTIGNQEEPIRKIVSGIDLENEIKSSGLSINYLYFHAELSFNVFDEYLDYPHQNLPQTARLAAKRDV